MVTSAKPVVQAPVAPAAKPVVRYAVTKKGSNAKLKAGTYAVGAAEDGNKGSLEAISKLGATFTLEQMQEACNKRNHKYFASYAIRRGWVAPVQS